MTKRDVCNHVWIILTTERYESLVFTGHDGQRMVVGAEGIRGCTKCFIIQGNSRVGTTRWLQREDDYGYTQIDERYNIRYNSRLRLFMRKPRRN